MKYYAKAIVGILTSKTELLDSVLEDLKGRFGETDIVGDWRIFDHSDYYKDEMGGDLKRTFVSFEKLVAPETARDFKAWTVEIENKYAEGKNRVVNLDAGFVDANKVVLISAKHGGHKIAVAENVWADMLLWHNKGWVAQPWAFPDFRDGGYFPLFLKMRSRYKTQLKELSA